MEKRAITGIVCFVCILLSISCSKKDGGYSNLGDIGKLAPGWRGEVIAKTDQSYVGFDVTIGDADNDGEKEILTASSPDSRLYLFKKIDKRWESRIIAERFAQSYPGMGLAVEIVDLNMDGKNEVIYGTGQLTGGIPALFYFIETDGKIMTNIQVMGALAGGNYYTHGLPSHDVDGDGVREVISAYCGGGEIIRYDVDEALTKIEYRIIHRVSASGEGSVIADVDNDGKMEYISVTGFQKDAAKVEIFGFDENGELIHPPKVIIGGYNGEKSYQASVIAGDVNNDGKIELVVAWKRDENIHNATIIGYKVGKTAVPVYTFSYDDDGMDTGFFENAMAKPMWIMMGRMSLSYLL